MALNLYIQQVQRLLHDPNAQYFSLADLTQYINNARELVAQDGQCVRLLLSGGTIMSININSGGTGYSGNLTVSINGAGQQASATGTISGGTVNTISVTNGGWGYITGTTTTVTATGSIGGSNATFIPVINQSLTTVPFQEVYKFNTANMLVQSLGLGIQAVLGLMSVSCSWGTNAAMKPILKPMIWTDFQAYYRSYNNGMANYPTIWSQYGQGDAGSVYLWPLPSQPSQMDWDCYCIPSWLNDDTSPDCIPHPWTNCVQYYAAYMAYLDAQRNTDADNMFKRYEMFMKKARAQSETPFVPDYYQSDF